MTVFFTYISFFIVILVLFLILLIIKIFIAYYFSNISKQIKNTCLYTGRVQHVRLKGGAIHKLNYPLFLACVDIDELNLTQSIFWPLFSINRPWTAFSSFDFNHHLKDFHVEKDLNKNEISSFKEKIIKFIVEKSNGKMSVNGSIQILTNLSYFGYCFNPISLYYLNDKENKSLEGIIAEVSNTPWIEMNTYLLSDTVQGVKITRDNDFLKAIWKKDFHVSPFMEMDYFYSFNFKKLGDKAVVKSSMFKESTHETWFTANFDLNRIEFTPLNLIYVLTFFPLQTRFIQIYIHIEAFKLFWKGVPTFSHPLGKDVDLGFGISGRNVSSILWSVSKPFFYLQNLFSPSKVKSS